MAREHRVRLTVPNLTQDQADQVAAGLGDAATVTHEDNLPVTPNTTSVVIAVRAQRPQTAGERAATQVAEILADTPVTPLWEVVAA